MTDSPAIVVKDLHKSYGDFEAVRGIDLEVASGEVFGLLGPNGAGKTTTVEILEGLRPRSSGTVSVLGFDPALQSRQVKDRVGICLQATNLPDKIKVIEALQLFGAFYSHSADPDKLLGILQLSDKREAFYKSLSGGQKQRVALALALVNEPKLLFLDEPTTGLDPQVRHEIHRVLQELKENKRSILMTTHYIEEAERLCDRVAIIDAGKIIELGTPREIQQRVMGHSLLEITADRAIPEARLPERLRDQKHSLRDEDRTIAMQTDSPAATIVELVKWIDQEKLTLLDIQLKRPTLEDVFIELTGKKLRE
ncbi:MAG TPA: ABC transporter ATP-binding protein [Bryobacteraceae bacterium]|jgi:ABC-2 type transport system ATP-binding protein|nr:ABC transporter ATP-binding protein [Bryobacteraceae bacterium]